MSKAILIEKLMPTICKERRRNARYFGPSATGTSFDPIDKTWTIEEPEIVLQVNWRMNSKSLSSAAADNKINLLGVLFAGGSEPVATSTATTTGTATEGDRLVIDRFENQKVFALVTSGLGGYSEITTKSTIWSTWAWLLEEDDVLELEFIASTDVTDTDWADVTVEILTARPDEASTKAQIGL